MRPLEVLGVNVWAVLTAGVAIAALRFFWFSPLPFRRLWNRSDETRDPPRKQFLEYALLLATSLITAFVLAEIIRVTTADTALEGIKIGVGVWLGFVAAVLLTESVFQRKPAKFYFVETGFQLLCFAAMGAIIAPWHLKPQAGTESGFGVFKEHCMSCHGKPDTMAPDPSTLRELTPEAIYAALTTGAMKAHGQNLTDDEKRSVAEALSGRPLGASLLGDAAKMPNHCPNNPPLSDPFQGPIWNGWGVDPANTRFQTAGPAGLSAADVPRLRLKWAFGYPNGVSAFGQPTIASGRVFVGADIGYVYSLDAAMGCIYWSFQTKAAVRSAISIGPVETEGSTRWAVYFGDAKANVYALDAVTGQSLWIKPVEDHFLARITGAPTLYEHTLYVPVSSSEEWSAASLSYPCCTFRGSIVALDAKTGKRLWKTYTIPQEPKPTRRNSAGTQLWAPAGAAVWSAPTVDAERNAIYFGTGDSYSDPAADTSDSIVALDMSSGKILWVFQGTNNDAYIGGCSGTGAQRSENCPKGEGLDWDFGASPILRTLHDGRRILVAAQKSGIVFGLDPDRQGALVWKTNLAEKRPRTIGLIVFGGAADEENAYFALTTGGMAALRLADGNKQWLTPIVAKGFGPDHVGMSAAVSAIPGVAFIGGWDGKLHALSTAGGEILWEFDTARQFATVNKVPAKGGSIGGSGSTIAGGMLFVGSGYAVFGGSMPGNVLLAFSTE